MEEFLEKAKMVLKRNATPTGMIAGYYYPDVWGRDGLITSLGLVASGDEELISLAKITINTLAKYQNRLGQLPNLVSPNLKKIGFGRGGCVDTSLWYPIAVLNYYRITKDIEFLNFHLKKIERAINWILSLDQNGDYLIEVTRGADWMDCLLRSGRVLYDEALLYGSLVATDKIRVELGKKQKYLEIAERVKESINLLLWPDDKNMEIVKKKFENVDIGIAEDYALLLESGARNYYCAQLDYGFFDWRCDVFGNVLAILFDVADKEKKELIFKHFEKEKVAEPYPVKVLFPPIPTGDPMWSHYFILSTRPSIYNKFVGHFPWLQRPGNYHNGGIWPFVGGFYVMALAKEGRDAASTFNKLIEANRLGTKEEWEFPEWISAGGRLIIAPEGIPRYSPYQSWSAGMFILASKWVEEGTSSLI